MCGNDNEKQGRHHSLPPHVVIQDVWGTNQPFERVPRRKDDCNFIRMMW
jgi:hypothetical protein